MQNLIEIVSKVFGVSVEDILSESKLLEHAEARKAFVYLAIDQGYARSTIARFINRWPGSVGSIYKACLDLMSNDTFREKVESMYNYYWYSEKQEKIGGRKFYNGKIYTCITQCNAHSTKWDDIYLVFKTPRKLDGII